MAGARERRRGGLRRGARLLPDIGELVHSERLEEIGIGAGEDALLDEVDRLVRGEHDDGDIRAHRADAGPGRGVGDDLSDSVGLPATSYEAPAGSWK